MNRNIVAKTGPLTVTVAPFRQLLPDGTWFEYAGGQVAVTDNAVGYIAVLVSTKAAAYRTAAQVAADAGNITATLQYIFLGRVEAVGGDIKGIENVPTPAFTAPVIRDLATISAAAIDWSLGPRLKKTTSGNITFTFANAQAGQQIQVLVTAGGSHTVTWPAGILWAGGTAPTQTASKPDLYTFTYDGTSYYGSAVQAFAVPS